MFRKYNIICGHYGTGKTNFALNAAFGLARQGRRVTLVDLDIVNPYFRSSDYRRELEGNGIRLISPGSANTTLDAPYLPAEISSVFGGDADHVFFDVGGDDAGATALGRYADDIKGNDGYLGIFVINKFRRMIENPLDALELLREIEAASHLTMNALVNNSHLSLETSAADILSGCEYAREVSRVTGLPLMLTTVPKAIMSELEKKIENPFPVETIVKLPWNNLDIRH